MTGKGSTEMAILLKEWTETEMATAMEFTKSLSGKRELVKFLVQSHYSWH
jgi:hypothetical protein